MPVLSCVSDPPLTLRLVRGAQDCEVRFSRPLDSSLRLHSLLAGFQVPAPFPFAPFLLLSHALARASLIQSPSQDDPAELALCVR